MGQVHDKLTNRVKLLNLTGLGSKMTYSYRGFPKPDLGPTIDLFPIQK